MEAASLFKWEDKMVARVERSLCHDASLVVSGNGTSGRATDDMS